jgi:phospholipase C
MAMTAEDRSGRGGLSRRELIAGLSAAGALAALGRPGPASAATRARAVRGVARAASTGAAGSDLGAVEHVVFLMMENRSYDHYFGTYPRGRGFDDHPPHELGVFAQAYPGGAGLHPPKVLLPFRLTRPDDECTKDLTHNWGPMHQCWNHGRMDSFVRVHTARANEGDPTGALTMGYYTRQELGFYYSVADHFTLADGYFCSILGPTHPNRVMGMSGTIDPAGKHGGPVTDTNPDPTVRWTCDWPTVPELLEDKGVSWKVYHPSNADLATLGAGAAKFAQLPAYPIWNPALYDPTANPTVLLSTDNPLPYFKAYENPATDLYKKAFLPTFPADFINDVKAGTLPSVSWLIPPLSFDEHASASPDHGMWFTSAVLDALVANPAVWSKTVLFLMYDENDGMFDHVSPPTAPKGTPGEWLTAKTISHNTGGIRGPLGLGVRVPMLVLSPFSRGGHIASETFDHTSQLLFLEERFGIKVSAISSWRRKTVGDLTSTLFRSRPDASMPALHPAPALGPPTFTGPCAEPQQETEFVGGSDPTIPTRQRMPTQDGRTVPAVRFHDLPGGGGGAGGRGDREEGSEGGARGGLADTGGLPGAVPALAAVTAAGVLTRAARRLRTEESAEDPH